MTQRFDELYIRRGEHQQIVAYYRKLVAHVCHKLRMLQDELDRAEPGSTSCGSAKEQAPVNKIAETGHSNVVQVDFRHPSRPRSKRS